MDLLYLFAICIINCLMFYNNCFGINVMIFNIIFLIFLIIYFKKNDLIKNKFGLLFTIPILLLSMTYSLYNNVFSILNCIVIPILYILMFIYTIKPTYKFSLFLETIFNSIFMPFDYIDRLFKDVKEKVIGSLKINDNTKRVIKSLIIVLPIILVILLLLSSADMVFGSMFDGLFDLVEKISFNNIIGRIVFIVILFTYIGATLYYLKNRFSTSLYKEKDSKVIDNYTINILLTSLNFIYIIFDFIQIKSLLLHQVGNTITYAEYAREGFFQLMFISLINLIIILLSKKSKNTNYIKISSICMILLTLIIIMSSIYRMYLYESMYGYTVLRLLVYVTLFTEIILIIPTISYILKSKVNILKYYMIIITSIYTLINLVSIDYVIAQNNIRRYYKTDKIDLYYLSNYRTDNIVLLKELYENSDEELKESLDNYFLDMKDNIDMNSVFEFNFSKNKAIKILK